MKTHFFDRQEDSNPRNGLEVSVEEISKVIDEARVRPPFFAELISDAGYTMLLGISPRLGCAQLSPNDGAPPYLMALAKSAAESDAHVEFLVANTPTPVPMRYCLPIDDIKRIAEHFLERGARDPSVDWEEI